MRDIVRIKHEIPTREQLQGESEYLQNTKWSDERIAKHLAEFRSKHSFRLWGPKLELLVENEKKRLIDERKRLNDYANNFDRCRSHGNWKRKQEEKPKRLRIEPHKIMVGKTYHATKSGKILTVLILSCVLVPIGKSNSRKTVKKMSVREIHTNEVWALTEANIIQEA